MSWGYSIPFYTGPSGSRSDPWQILREFQNEFNRVCDSNYPQRGYPAVNLWADKERAYLTAELPGIALADVDITILGNVLTVQGKKSTMAPQGDARFLRKERGAGDFSRSIELPFSVNADQVEAQLKNGVLLVTLPRAESDKPRKLTIKKG